MKKLKKILLVLVIVVLVGVLTLFSIDLYVRVSTNKNIQTVESLKDYTDDFDCIVVLGAGLKNDGTPSPMLQERLDRGIELYTKGIAPKIIMSGDHENADHDEVNAMKEYAIKEGVPSNDIFMDHAGLSTYDSMYRAKDIFGAEKVLVVTQKYHLYRAMYIGKNLGLTTIGVDAEKTKYSGSLYRETREVLARIKDFFKCMLKPKSTYGGDEIPVFGDGNDTNDKEYILIRFANSTKNKEIYINKKSDVKRIKYILETYEFTKKTCDGIADYIIDIVDGNKEYGIEVYDSSIHITKKKEEIVLDEDDSEFMRALLTS